jgi:chromosome segregation ATPase
MSSAKSQPERADPDSLADLEERVLRTVELVSTLRAERDAARKELAAARAEIEELSVFRKAEDEARSLREEITGLRAERKQVRLRIEKLLAQMDLVSRQ